MAERTVLLTGATGYIGGRLLSRLEQRGVRVRCLSRRPDVLVGRIGPTTEIVSADLIGAGDARRGARRHRHRLLPRPLDDLAHALRAGRPRRRDARSRALPRAQGVRRIVYLGGLGSGARSEHLESRQEVGEILRASGVPTIEFQASIVIGSGSTSFDMLRALVDRLPVMITPRWVGSRCQPIAIEDLLDYLMAALDHEPDGGEVFEIGGANVVTYRDLMGEYAQQRAAAPGDDPGARPDAAALEPLARTRHAGARARRPRARREPAQRHDRQRSARARGLPDPPAHRRPTRSPARCATRIASSRRPAGRTRRRRGHRLVRRPAPRLAPDRPAHRCTSSTAPAAAFAPIRRIGGASGWYSARTLWIAARRARLARRRARTAPWTPRPGRRAGRRHDRLLAGRGIRAGPPAPPARRDAHARPRLAAARGRCRTTPARRSRRRRSSTRTASRGSPTGT